LAGVLLTDSLLHSYFFTGKSIRFLKFSCSSSSSSDRSLKGEHVNCMYFQKKNTFVNFFTEAVGVSTVFVPLFHINESSTRSSTIDTRKAAWGETRDDKYSYQDPEYGNFHHNIFRAPLTAN
jgi:hypothetical protein